MLKSVFVVAGIGVLGVEDVSHFAC